MAMCVLYLVAGAGVFIATGVFAASNYFRAKAKPTEKKERNYWGAAATVCIIAGVIFFWCSLAEMHAITIGKAGTPRCLDKTMFQRALGSFPNLKGENFVPVQDALDKVTTVKSSIQPRRGDFLRVVETPTGPELEIIAPNSSF